MTWSGFGSAVCTALVGLALEQCNGTAGAQEMKAPRILPMHPQWSELSAELEMLGAPAVAVTTHEGDERKLSSPLMEFLAAVNTATGERFSNVSASPVPVLLPFDTAAFLRNHRPFPGDRPEDEGTGNYLSGFNSVPFFYAGSGGLMRLSSPAPRTCASWG
jgi:hypothetical protein